MPGARCTRSLVCSVLVAHECSHHGRTGNTRHSRTRMVLTVCFALSPVIGYRMHTSLLQRLAKTDSIVDVGLRRAVLCRWKLGWGDLAIVAWKKGGVVACGACSTALFVHSAPCREPGAGGAVHTFFAQ